MDVLFDARNALAVGNYHQAIAEGSNARCISTALADKTAFEAEKNAVVCLGQIGLGQSTAVVGQLRSAGHPLLVSVRQWAELMSALKDHGVESVAFATAAQALQQAAEEVTPTAVYAAVFAASSLLFQHNYVEALTLVKKWLGGLPRPEGSLQVRRTLELHGIAIEALLQLHRPDEAAKEITLMEQIEREATSTLLYSGIVSLHQAVVDVQGSNYTAALRAFKEVQLRCGSSVMVSNLVALAHVGLQDFSSAQAVLTDALAMRSNDEATLANLAALSAHTTNTLETSTSYIDQCLAMQGAWSETYRKKEQSLEAAIRDFVDE